MRIAGDIMKRAEGKLLCAGVIASECALFHRYLKSVSSWARSRRYRIMDHVAMQHSWSDLSLIVGLLLMRIRSHLQFELRYNEVERARDIYERYVEVLPTIKAWVRYAKFEMKGGNIPLARACYERALTALGDDALQVRELSHVLWW